MKLNLFTVLCLTGFVIGCSKKNTPSSPLPAATHIGANTFGCNINGKPFVVKGIPSFLSGFGVQATGPFAAPANVAGLVFISANCSGPRQDIDLNFQFWDSLKVYSGDMPHGWRISFYC